jgi:ABC-2 type transport system ATP-binding protein
MDAITFSHVSKIYRKGFWGTKVPAVRDLSFSVARGGITGFVGPNGSGKTTSIKMLLGLVLPTSGRIEISGNNASNPKSRAGCAFISEQPYFYRHLTVAEALRFSARLEKRGAALSGADVDRALETVDLVNCGKRKIKELSKGMQQRLAMAQALLADADILIFDEPMSGMDPPGRALFRTIIASLGARGKTVFFSTHVLDDVEQLCGNVVVLSGGRLEYQGPIGAILEKGFIGFELTVGSVSGEIQNDLRARGYTLESTDAALRIFAATEKQAAACQRYLYERDIFCLSIARHSAPLEEVLYKKKSGAAS